MITLREITVKNFWDVIELKVRPDQEELVTSNAVSIGQAKVQPECIPLAIYHGDTPVGFAMYCVDRDDNEYWLYRLMIDQHFQGRGFGRAAMVQLIQRIRQDQTRHRIFLGVDIRGTAAVKLYETLGFAFNGQVFGKEHIMVLSY